MKQLVQFQFGNQKPGASAADPTNAQDLATKNYVDTPRSVTLTVASNTYTPDATAQDVAIISSPSAAFTVAAPTSPYKDGQGLLLRVKSGGTGYAPTWNAIYASSGICTLPTGACPASKTVTFGFIYDLAQAKFMLMAMDFVGY